MIINNHDIIRVLEPVYISYPGGLYKNHFITKKVLYRVKTEPSNNGNFIAINAKNILKHFNTETNKDIIEIVKK